MGFISKEDVAQIRKNLKHTMKTIANQSDNPSEKSLGHQDIHPEKLVNITHHSLTLRSVNLDDVKILYTASETMAESLFDFHLVKITHEVGIFT